MKIKEVVEVTPEKIDEFLNDFPTVKREQALGVLELMRERLLTEYETAA